MLIRRGWASEYAKRRFDIELSSQEDLPRLVAEREPEATPEQCAQVVARMTLGDIYLALDAEAMMFVHHTLSEFEPAAAEKHQANMRIARAKRDQVLSKYLPRPEPEPSG